MKNYAADLYEDYKYSEKLLGITCMSGAGEVRLILSTYAPNHCHSLKVNLV